MADAGALPTETVIIGDTVFDILMGANAGVLVPFAGAANPFSGAATLTDDQAAALQAGKTYVNIHTAANRGGEKSDQEHGGANMAGAQPRWVQPPPPTPQANKPSESCSACTSKARFSAPTRCRRPLPMC